MIYPLMLASCRYIVHLNSKGRTQYTIEARCTHILISCPTFLLCELVSSCMIYPMLLGKKAHVNHTCKIPYHTFVSPSLTLAAVRGWVAPWRTPTSPPQRRGPCSTPTAPLGRTFSTHPCPPAQRASSGHHRHRLIAEYVVARVVDSCQWLDRAGVRRVRLCRRRSLRPRLSKRSRRKTCRKPRGKRKRKASR
jgi:hypothetical protein